MRLANKLDWKGLRDAGSRRADVVPHKSWQNLRLETTSRPFARNHADGRVQLVE
jgi:hypothetical protein